MPIVDAPTALSAYTTLRLGGPAGQLVDAGSAEQIVGAVRASDRAGEPLLILGGGSNLVVADAGFPGTVVRITSQGVAVRATPEREPDTTASATIDSNAAPRPTPGSVIVTVAAGEPWDRFVEWTVHEGLAGLECLSGIPGLAGATPIQNVGAYGQDVAQTITEVTAFDRERDEVVSLTGAQCGFGYRTSMFKRAAAGTATGRFVVLDVSFRLSAQSDSAQPGPALSAPVSYAQLAAALGVAEGERAALPKVRAAVLALRRGKGMLLDTGDRDSCSAGSFFTNPVLTAAEFSDLQRRAAQRWGSGTPVPSFAAGDDANPGSVKVPAAWLIERAGFGKGYPGSGVATISTKHTLALTHRGGGSTAALLSLAREITDGVRASFHVDLVIEPVLVGVEL